MKVKTTHMIEIPASLHDQRDGVATRLQLVLSGMNVQFVHYTVDVELLAAAIHQLLVIAQNETEEETP